ncbi:FISUMP domain-containing protein [Zhouia amylolytica]|uniref:Fibrobacter succinogenes major paralogous domain-containing protein n=1 Tax=Zhouia amylolytica AD3 TaxID=1286632 RepID=W2UK89_9FLAO|nr:FISUMP domain-containing protein [Zhouia amylolytica]ETN94413.1 hypothetical protein P278_23560 [Zhouia amylolytica AD3]
MKPKLIPLFLCLSILCACSNDDDNLNNTFQTGSLTDNRDGQTYKTVRIGTQIWMAENMKFDTGDNSSICYENEAYNCFVYGRLYTGDAAQTICPEGWHLPTVEEWYTLFDYFGGEDVAYAFLEPYGMIHEQAVEFNILPTGRSITTNFEKMNEGYYWTSTDGGYPESFRYINYKPGASFSTPGASQTVMQSCRCLKD